MFLDIKYLNDNLLYLDLSGFQELCASDLKLVHISVKSNIIIVANDYLIYLNLSDFQEVCASDL
jgi:hypothetical protein